MRHISSGKVREIYQLDEDQLLLVTSDRMSAFDVVIAEPIADKGRVLTALLGKKFDLIWCGSLVTHLNERSIRDLLLLFRRHLSAGGLLLFTTHGDFVARRLPTRDFDYMLAEEQIDGISSNYRATGYAFEDYLEAKDWGVSLTSPEWIRAQVREVSGLHEVFFRERGWDNHQDVFGFVLE